MKKIMLLLVCAFALTVCLSACSTVYTLLGKTPDQVHQETVDKVSNYAADLTRKKIDASEDLSAEDKEKLNAEVTKLKTEIVAKIAEMKAKVDAVKAAKTEKTVEPEKNVSAPVQTDD